jgi:uncharacterized cupin superfamily protein
MDRKPPVSIAALTVAPRLPASLAPEPFKTLLSQRIKRQLGEVFGLTNFGVNLVQIEPGGRSSMRHAHKRQDEFIYVIEGTPTLITNAGETVLQSGDCAGFKAGSGDAHCLINHSPHPVLYLEMGDRSEGDDVSYPDDDLKAVFEDGRWLFLHKDGRPY